MTVPSARWDKNHPSYKWIALSNTTMGMLVATINGSIVLISLPAIFRGIQLNPLAPQNVSYLLWMIMGFLLVSAVLVVTLGRLGDMYGRVKVYNLGFLVFFLSSVLLAIEPLSGSGGALWIIGWSRASAARCCSRTRPRSSPMPSPPTSAVRRWASTWWPPSPARSSA
jgi:MFS family permease